MTDPGITGALKETQANWRAQGTHSPARRAAEPPRPWLLLSDWLPSHLSCLVETGKLLGLAKGHLCLCGAFPSVLRWAQACGNSGPGLGPDTLT